MSDLYDNPKYYEIAFSFRDIPAEVEEQPAIKIERRHKCLKILF